MIYVFPLNLIQVFFQRLISNKDRVDIGETAGTYKLNYINETNEKGFYIGKTKRTIKKKELKSMKDI